ncbi:MAG: PAS domain S-box protein, partial [Saprospiraceae bacterium]
MKVIEKLEEDIVVLKKPDEKREIAISQLSFHLENSPLAFIEWDKKGVAKSWSKRAEEIFGWTAAEFIGTNGLSQVYKDDLPKVTKIFNDLISLKTRRNQIHNRNITKDGRIIWCAWFNSVTLDKHGEVVKIMSLVKDVTKRKRAKELKEYAQIEKEALINATDDMMWSVSKDYKLLAANKAFIQGIEALVGVALRPGDSILIDSFPEDMLSFWKESYSRVLVGEKLKEEVYTPPHDQYQEFWSETSFEPIYHNKAVIGVACHSRDITERKLNDREKEKKAAELVIANQELLFQNTEKEKRAAELIISNKELAFLIEEKEKQAAELIKSNKELTAFSYVTSHDLQEPLRKIQTLASHLLAKENQNLSEKGKKYFRLLGDSANQMRTLITDLLTFSHLDSESSQFETTDLKMIIDEVKAEFKETLAEENVRIEFNNLPCANIIPFQFRQLLHNLIGNAIKYSNPLIPLQITIKSKIIHNSQLINKDLLPGIDYCHLMFIDNGIGFEPQYKDKIFEVFQKLHGKEEYAGSGIGLAIVKKIVDNHNGFITA